MYPARPVYSSRLNKNIWLEVHFQSQFNAPPEFLIASKLFSQIHTPRVFLGTQETVHASMPLLYPAKIIHHEKPSAHPCHKEPCISHAIGRVRCTHMPWHLCFLVLWNIRGEYCDWLQPYLNEFLSKNLLGALVMTDYYLLGDALTSSLRGIACRLSYLDLILSQSPVSSPIPAYWPMILIWCSIVFLDLLSGSFVQVNSYYRHR